MRETKRAKTIHKKLRKFINTPKYFALFAVVFVGAVALLVQQLHLRSLSSQAASVKPVSFLGGKVKQSIASYYNPTIPSGQQSEQYTPDYEPSVEDAPTGAVILPPSVTSGHGQGLDREPETIKKSGPVAAPRVTFFPAQGNYLVRSDFARSARLNPTITIDFGDDKVTALGYALFKYPTDRDERETSIEERDIRCPNGEVGRRFTCTFRVSPRIRNMPLGTYTLTMSILGIAADGRPSSDSYRGTFTSTFEIR